MKHPFSFDKFRIFSGSALKTMALISMFIDHFALVLSPELPFMTAPLFPLFGEQLTLYFLLRKVGRLAFPLYAFLIGEGLSHTRNRPRYLGRLLAFAVLSEIPFNLMIHDTVWFVEKQNIFFTLFLGALMIHLFETIKGNLPKALLLLAVSVAAVVLRVDYGLLGVVLIFAVSLLRKQPAAQLVVAFPLLSDRFAAVWAFLPINLYNGKRGFIRSGFWKHLFYVFYPVHILLLWLIRQR